MSTTRDYIIDAVKENNLKRKRSYPDIEGFLSVSDQFKRNLVTGAGTWYDVRNAAEAEALIRKIHPEAKVICSAAPEIKGNKDLAKATNTYDLNDVDVGVVRAQFGVSETGMVCLAEDERGANALGFLSQHLIVLLKPDQIARNMYEAYMRIYLERCSYGCFMLGPSATVGNGASMVHGSHGGRSLTVFFM